MDSRFSICQAGFENLLARELAELHDVAAVASGPGWVRVESALRVEELAFAHLTLIDPIEVRGDSVNALAGALADHFLASLRGERVEAAWPNLWLGVADRTGLGRRISAIEDAWTAILKKKMSRVIALANPAWPRDPGAVRGCFVFFPDFDRAWVSRSAFAHGQRRMADDPLAPSRSYLKVEEAYAVAGCAPQAGETVCDLGAAPGGWSFSAARRGARVIAVDNGPLKGGALNHPLIEHRRGDAFSFRLPEAMPFDWLFCDLVEEPHHVLQNIVEPWLERRWCRRFVINLKFGRVDPVALLRELRGPDSPFVRRAAEFRIRHLFHDREELTITGKLSSE